MCDLPLEALAISGHEALLDEVEDGVALDRLELGVQCERPCEVDHDLFGPVDAELRETDFAHHGVARFVPELASHVAIVVPRFGWSLGDDAGHHFGDIDFAEPLVEHHQCFGQRREFGVVEENFGVDAHVVGIGKSFIAARDGIILIWLGGILPNELLCGRCLGAIESTSVCQAIVEESKPLLIGFA